MWSKTSNSESLCKIWDSHSGRNYSYSVRDVTFCGLKGMYLQTTQLHIIYNCSHYLCLVIRDQENHLLGGPLIMTLSGTGHNSQYYWLKYVTKTTFCLLVVSRTSCYNLRTRFLPAVLTVVLSACNKNFPMGSTRVHAFPSTEGWSRLASEHKFVTYSQKKKTIDQSSMDSGYFT